VSLTLRNWVGQSGIKISAVSLTPQKRVPRGSLTPLKNDFRSENYTAQIYMIPLNFSTYEAVPAEVGKVTRFCNGATNYQLLFFVNPITTVVTKVANLSLLKRYRRYKNNPQKCYKVTKVVKR
jgi:hypothetical protein